MPITNYQIYHNSSDGFEGQLFSTMPHRSSTYLNVSGEPMPIGCAVVVPQNVRNGNNNDKQMTVPSNSNDKFLGILMLQNFYERTVNENDRAFIPKNGYGIVLKQGVVKVYSETSVKNWRSCFLSVFFTYRFRKTRR